MSRKTIGSIVLLLVLALVAPAQEAAKKHKFNFVHPEKDTTFVNASDTGMDLAMAITMNGETMMSMAMKSAEKKIVERKVLEVGEKGITKMRYKMTRFESSQSMDMGGEAQTSADEDGRLGGTFIVALQDGKIVVTDEEGAEVDEGLLESFRGEDETAVAAGRLHDPTNGMEKVVGGKEIAIGESIDMSKDMVREMMKGAQEGMGDADVDIKKASLTLVRTAKHLGNECGVFKVEMKLAGKGDNEGMAMTMSFDMEGEFFIGLENCWVYKSEMSGPLVMAGSQSAEGAEMKMDGKGKAKVLEDVAVTKAK